MVYPNSPDRSQNVSTPRTGLSAKLAQAAAALSMMAASTAASAEEVVRKVTAECADGQHMDYVVKDGVFIGKCVDDEEGDKPAPKKVAAKPKPVPVCTDAGEKDVLETRPQTMSAINALSKVNISKEGKYEITEGQSAEFRINCVDTFNKGKTEKPINDKARLEAVIGSQVKVTVNGNVVYPTVVTMDGYDVLLELNLPGPVTDTVPAAAHHVVVQTTGTQRTYDILVKPNPAKQEQKDALTKAQKDSEEAKKAAERAQQEAEEARKNGKAAPAPTPAPVPAPQPAPTPVAKNEDDEFTSYGTAGVTVVQMLGRPSHMISPTVSFMDQRAEHTAVGGSFSVGFEKERETVVQGQEVTGGASTHLFPAVRVVQGAQREGFAAQADIGVDIELGNKLVLPNGVTHSGDTGVSFRTEAGIGYTLKLRKNFSLRLMAVGGVLAGGLDKLDSTNNAATRWNAGASINLIGHND